MLNPRMLVAVGVSGLLSAGCGSVGFHGQQTPFGAPEVNRPLITPHAIPAGTQRGAGTRIVCRTSGNGDGWIAIDYLENGEGCATSAKTGRGHPYALVVDYHPYAIGDVLEVCGDEMVPAGWTVEQWLDPDGRCPPDHRSSEDQKTVKRIRRVN